MTSSELHIECTSSGRYRLLYEGDAIGCSNSGYDFYKIERLSPESNYWQLWPNDSCFYLYYCFPRTSTFVGGATPFCFISVDSYSEVTGSFAAQRCDSEYKYLMYEDSPKPQGTFLEIGEESDDSFRSRAVKYISFEEKWCFFDVKNKRFEWNKDYGYRFKHSDWALHKKLPNSYFSIQVQKEYFYLAYYKKGVGHNIFIKYLFSSIERLGDRHLVGKKDDGYYVFDTGVYKPVPVCSSVSEPILTQGNIIGSDKECHFVVHNGRTVRNCNWKASSEFFAYKDYAFCKDEDSNSWKIYQLNDDCAEVFLDWRNIRIVRTDGQAPFFLVDTATDSQIKKSIDDIQIAQSQFFASLQNAYANLGLPSAEDHASEATQAEETVKENRQKQSTVSQDVLDLPSHIDFIASGEHILLDPKRKYVLCSRKKCDRMSMHDIILWYDRTARVIFITEYVRTNTYKFLCKTANIPDGIGLDIPRSFTKVRIKISGEKDLLEKLTADYGVDISLSEEENNKKEQVKTFLRDLGYSTNAIKAALAGLYPHDKI